MLKKSLLAAAAAATALASVPAEARHDRWRGHDGIDAGDVIAGALIIGGIAAIASAASNDRYDSGYGYRDRRYGYGDRRYGYGDRGYGYGGYDGYGYYNNGYGSRVAVDQCVRAARAEAGRYGRARVTDVTGIDRIRGGYEVTGRLVVADRGYWRDRYDGWDRGYHYDRYGDGYDKGRFRCVARYGRVEWVRLGGLG